MPRSRVAAMAASSVFWSLVHALSSGQGWGRILVRLRFLNRVVNAI